MRNSHTCSLDLHCLFRPDSASDAERTSELTRFASQFICDAGFCPKRNPFTSIRWIHSRILMTILLFHMRCSNVWEASLHECCRIGMFPQLSAGLIGLRIQKNCHVQQLLPESRQDEHHESRKKGIPKKQNIFCKFTWGICTNLYLGHWAW